MTLVHTYIKAGTEDTAGTTLMCESLVSFSVSVASHVQGVVLVWAVIPEQLKWCNYPWLKAIYDLKKGG